MRFAGVPAIEIIGGIAIGICGLLPFWRSAIPADSQSHDIPVQATRIQAVDSDKSPDHNSIADQGDRTTVDNGPEDAANSTVESRLRTKVELLDRGMRFLQGVPDYTATFQKQELVRGALLDEQTICVKCRHKPFSVYLRWLSGDTGREVLYIDGQNNGNMIAHDGGWKSRIPALSLSTDGMMAMRDARYPVTTAGLLGLIKTMVGIHLEDLSRSNVASCDIDPDRQFDGRPCSVFTTKQKSAKDSPVYRKSITWIDQEWSVPLHTRHFEWSPDGTTLAEEELDQATLLEAYSFTDIKLRCGLTDQDFDRTNQEYQFR